MTTADTRRLLAYCVTVLPSIRLPEEPQLSRMVDAWTDLLEDLPYPVVQQAVRAVLGTQEGAWLPTPGAIRQAAARLQAPPVPDAETAWGLVLEAVRRFGYWRPAEALASLPEPVRTVAAHLGWDAICEANPDVLRGQWRAYYTAHVEAAARQAVVAPALRDGALADAPAGPGRAARPVVPLSAVVDRWRRPQTR
jgi:hypothetical protein